MTSTGGDCRTSMRLTSRSSSHGVSTTVCRRTGRAFAVMDRLLDEARAGAVYLRQPAVANMIVEAIHYNANVLGHYQLHAFVVMPNHLHLLATPAVALPNIDGIVERHHGQTR